jgi:hypothetical protein
MWRHTLKALATHLGSDDKPTQELVEVDRKRLWHNAGKKNAMLRRRATG